MIVRENLFYLLNENMQQAKSILKKLGVPETNPRFQEIKRILLDDNRIGYIGKFTKWLFLDRESMSMLLSTYEMIKRHPSQIPPINTFNKLEDLSDFLQKSVGVTKTNQVINALSSKTRKYVTDKLIKLINLNLEYADAIQRWYHDKASGKYNEKSEYYTLPKEFETYADWLYKDTETFIKNLTGGFNGEVIKKKIRDKKLNVEIALDTPNMLVVKVLDYKASNALGEPLAWCISYPVAQDGPGYWNRYVDIFHNQYFIHDFTKSLADKRSKIGVTIGPEMKFEYAHYRDDTHCEEDYIKSLFSSET
jgi:hypothetical protein